MESSNMNNNIYKNGKIYKIVDIGYNEEYFGSTTVELSSRMSKHRTSYRRWANGSKDSCTSFLLFEKFGLDNCKIELVEVFPCNSKEELRKREGYWIKHEECVNKSVAGRTQREYIEDNREMILEGLRQYNIQNKDKIKERRDKHRKENNYNEQRKEKTTCEVCGACFRKWDNNRHEKSKKHQNAVSQ